MFFTKFPAQKTAGISETAAIRCAKQCSRLTRNSRKAAKPPRKISFALKTFLLPLRGGNVQRANKVSEKKFLKEKKSDKVFALSRKPSTFYQ